MSLREINDNFQSQRKNPDTKSTKRLSKTQHNTHTTKTTLCPVCPDKHFLEFQARAGANDGCLLLRGIQLIKCGDKASAIVLLRSAVTSMRSSGMTDVAINQLVRQLISQHQLYEIISDGISAILPATRAVLFDMSSLEKFREWMQQEIVRRVPSDPILSKKAIIRDLEQKYREPLEALNATEQSTRLAYSTCPHRSRIETLEKMIDVRCKAVEEMTSRLTAANSMARDEDCDSSNSSPSPSDTESSPDTPTQPTSLSQPRRTRTKLSAEKRLAIEKKRTQFQAEYSAAVSELQELQEICTERQAWDRAKQSRAEYRKEIGITEAEYELESLNRTRGKINTLQGAAFEGAAEMAINHIIWPQRRNIGLSTAVPVESGDPFAEMSPRPILTNSSVSPMQVPINETEYLYVLHGVTLGIAIGELDQVGVRAIPGQPAEVLFVVECKSNCREISYGFGRLQHMLAWFCGCKDAYKANEFRTRVYTSGHFDQQAEHHEHNMTFTFTKESFRFFKRTPAGLFVDGVYLVTRAGTLDWILPKDAMKLLHKVVTDRDYDPTSDRYWKRLYEWTRECIPSQITIQTNVENMKRYSDMVIVMQPLLQLHELGL